MSPAHSMTVNNLLIAALPDEEQQRFLAGCEKVDLRYADSLCEPGDSIRHVYFPENCSISLLAPAGGNARLEVGLIGHEGLLGAFLAFGVDVYPFKALVQGTGTALRMRGPRFRGELERCPALQYGLKRYTYVLMCQLAQMAACARFHVVEKRLARWLLMTQDRAHSDQFHMTHEFLASMLGVRRVGVTKAASALQQRQLIHYSRGDIKILDRNGLEAASCECYHTDKAIYQRVFG